MTNPEPLKSVAVFGEYYDAFPERERATMPERSGCPGCVASTTDKRLCIALSMKSRCYTQDLKPVIWLKRT